MKIYSVIVSGLLLPDPSREEQYEQLDSIKISFQENPVTEPIFHCTVCYFFCVYGIVFSLRLRSHIIFIYILKFVHCYMLLTF